MRLAARTAPAAAAAAAAPCGRAAARPRGDGGETARARMMAGVPRREGVGAPPGRRGISWSCWACESQADPPAPLRPPPPRAGRVTQGRADPVRPGSRPGHGRGPGRVSPLLYTINLRPGSRPGPYKSYNKFISVESRPGHTRRVAQPGQPPLVSAQPRPTHPRGRFTSGAAQPDPGR